MNFLHCLVSSVNHIKYYTDVSPIVRLGLVSYTRSKITNCKMGETSVRSLIQSILETREYRMGTGHGSRCEKIELDRVKIKLYSKKENGKKQ